MQLIIQKVVEASEGDVIKMAMRLGHALDRPGSASSAPMTMLGCGREDMDAKVRRSFVRHTSFFVFHY
jgi:hypothetical protein